MKQVNWQRVVYLTTHFRTLSSLSFLNSIDASSAKDLRSCR